MAGAGYKNLISYKLAQIAFDLGWDFVPQYYRKIEDSRQRDQIKQALRSHKQNIVEGSSERSLSAKLKLYDVSKSSGMEALEDSEDILRFERLPRWDKNDPRLRKLRQIFEGYPSFPSTPSIPPHPSVNPAPTTLRSGHWEFSLCGNNPFIPDLTVRAFWVRGKSGWRGTRRIRRKRRNRSGSKLPNRPSYQERLSSRSTNQCCRGKTPKRRWI